MRRWNVRTCKHTGHDIEEEGAEEEDRTNPKCKNEEQALFFLKYAGMQNEEGGGSRGEKSPFLRLNATVVQHLRAFGVRESSDHACVPLLLEETVTFAGPKAGVSPHFLVELSALG